MGVTTLRDHTRAVIWQLIEDRNTALALQITRWWKEKTGERL